LLARRRRVQDPSFQFDALSAGWHCSVMKRPNRVDALPGHRIELSFPDGTVGVIDLSNSVGKGVFTSLQDEAFFKTVHIGEFGQIAWSEHIEICADAAYLEIKEKAAHQLTHA
jgi:hypothetical protein